MAPAPSGCNPSKKGTNVADCPLESVAYLTLCEVEWDRRIVVNEGVRAHLHAPTGRDMRILLHDYSGHPFQVQLTRALAARGHEALHLHCPSFTTGKGALEVRDDDPATFH